MFRRRQRVPAPAQPQRRFDAAEVEAFTEHARWLHGVHNANSEAIATRAGVLLGFFPVAFPLLVINLISTAHKSLIAKSLLIATLVLLVASAYCCFRVVQVRTVALPEGDHTRELWHRYTRGGLRNVALAQIAHAYLGGDPARDPILTAKDETASRAHWFKWAVRFLLYAVAALAALGIYLIQRA